MAEKILAEDSEESVISEEGEAWVADDGTYYVYVFDAGAGDDSDPVIVPLICVADAGAGDDGINPLLQTVVIPDFGHGADVFTRRKDNIYNTLNITFTPKLGKIIYNA